MSSYLLNKADQLVLCSRLNALVSYAQEKFSFYQKIFKTIPNKNIRSLQDLANFPILDKTHSDLPLLIEQALTQNPPAYFETSGTSGNPFPVIPDLGPKRSSEFANFISEWLSLDKNKVNKAIIALPFEMNPIGLKYFMALNHLGIMAIPVGVKTHLCPPKKLLEVIERLQPELLIARPLETLRYAEAMISKGLDPKKSSIKKIILTGEIVSKAKFKRISNLYGGAEVKCVYGLTEVDSGGLVSCSRYQYHLPSKPYLLIELLEDDFKTPVLKAGNIGNILLTNTHQNYMPLFRYKTGDFGRLEHNCGCEFDTPVINIMGRASDCINHDGKRVFTIEIEDILFQYDNIASDYQIIVDNGETELRIELIEARGPTEISSLMESLKSNIYMQLALTINHIEIFMPGQLVNKLGIAKGKAGTLYTLDGLNEKQKNEYLQINYCCEDRI